MRTETRKKLTVHLLAAAIAAAAGLGIGFSLRKEPPEQERPATAVTQEQVEASARKGMRSEVRAGVDASSPAAKELEGSLSMSDPVTHWLYWLDAIEKASLADMPSLALKSGGDATLLRMIGERWMAMDAQNLFDWLIAREGNSGGVNIGSLEHWFRQEWAKSDPEALIQALREAPAFGARRSWRQSIATSLVQVDPEMGLRLMHEWHIENYGPGTKGISKWAAENPRHAAEFTLAHPAGYATQVALEMIGKEWGEQAPVDALEFATSGGGDLRLKEKLAAATMKSWAEQDLTKAGEWLAGAEDSLREQLSPHLVESWAKNDPARALVWCEQNLEGTALKEAAGGVLKGAAEKDVEMAARLVMVMEPSPARSQGAVAVAEKWVPDSFSGKNVPREAMEWLGKLDASSRREVLREVHWRWAGSDPKSLAGFVLEQSDPELPREVYSSVVNALARKFPIEAIEWSEQLPEEKRAQVSEQAFNTWREFQPQTAMDWLYELPAKDPRRKIFFESAIKNMATYERQSAEQLGALPVELRGEAREILESLSLEAEKKAKLLGALE